jgi:hypothetical protein
MDDGGIMFLGNPSTSQTMGCGRDNHWISLENIKPPAHTINIIVILII